MQIGLSIQNYASTYHNAYPPAGQLIPSGDGPPKVGGYSFLVRLLSFMEYDSLYKQLPSDLGDTGSVIKASAYTTGGSGSDAKAQALSDALNTPFRELICPSNGNSRHQFPTRNPPQFALTNYKAMGASSWKSLVMCASGSDSSSLPAPYGKSRTHPDGAIYPSAGDLPASDIRDGLSHTIFIMETIDDSNSRWMIGSECVLTGLPVKSCPVGPLPEPPHDYFAPPGYVAGKWGDNSAVSQNGLATFLRLDFSRVGQYNGSSTFAAYGATGAYQGDPGSQWTVTDARQIATESGVDIEGPAYGPSSSAPVGGQCGDGRRVGTMPFQADRRRQPVLPDHEEQWRSVLYSLDGGAVEPRTTSVPGRTNCRSPIAYLRLPTPFFSASLQIFRNASSAACRT